VAHILLADRLPNKRASAGSLGEEERVERKEEREREGEREGKNAMSR
jgi:hypothetical protein